MLVNKGDSFIPEGAVLYRYSIAPGAEVSRYISAPGSFVPV